MATSNISWLDEETIEFAGMKFLAGYEPSMYTAKSTLERFVLLKAPWQLDAYMALIDDVRPTRIVELGIWQGGSAVFFQKACSPQKIVVFDLNPQRLTVLDEYIREHGLNGVIKPYYGVNQADRARIGAVLLDEFPKGELDLVIDDASHFFRETRESFNLLFPKLRPGGAYVIEDWGWEHRPLRPGGGDPFIGKQAMTNLVFELTMTLATNRSIIPSITLMPGILVVKRGDERLGADFDVSRSFAVRDPRDFTPVVESIGLAPSTLVARHIRRTLDGHPRAARLWDAAARRMGRAR